MTRQQPRRKGATLVETTFVLMLVLTFMMGIYEYGRYIFTLQIVENAAREGARYAIAHTQDKTMADITAHISSKVTGADSQLSNYAVTVTAMVLKPKSGQTAGTVIPDWTDASPTDGIVVEISGDYTPILPGLMYLTSTLPVRAKAVMYSEGN